MGGKIYPRDDIQFDNAGGASKVIMPSPCRFRPCGESGIEMSDLIPHMQGIADEMTLIRSMNLLDIRNHLGGINAFDTGRARSLGRPSLGSWLTYDLGTESQTLPGFVAMTTGGPPVGAPHWNCGFLPSVYDGTLIRDEEPRILNLDPPPHLKGSPQQRSLQLLRDLNEIHLDNHPGESDLAARIASYDLAAGMQLAGSEALDLSQEPESVQKLYGLETAEGRRREFAEACLIARRLVERGVRFVQIWDNSWDHHERIDHYLPISCANVDQASAALVLDLKQRGLLDSTIVHWGGEMGRLPVVQRRPDGAGPGRDHNTVGFSMWVAGGGFKKGHVHGVTDEFGLNAVENVVHHFDYHATLLHLFGLDFEQLIYNNGVKGMSLLDGQPGKVIIDILA